MGFGYRLYPSYELHLSAYAPLKYVRMEKREEYSRKYDMKVGNGSSVFKQVDREQRLK